jgi:hypothetical protein
MRQRHRPPSREGEGNGAPDGVDHESLGAPLSAQEIRAVGITTEFVLERYSEKYGIDLLGQWEDFNLGTDARLTTAFSSRELGAAREGFFFLFDGNQGLASGRTHFLLAEAYGLGQVVAGQFHDTVLRLELRYYSTLTARHTLALRLRGDRGVRLAPQNVLTIGAEEGLRGFDAYSYWGERLLLASAEDRVLIAEDLYGLLSLGLVSFLDAGTTWVAGEHRQARLRLAGGFGLRLQGSRTSGRLVTRIDAGYPLAGGEPGEGWIVSFAAGQAF